MPQRLFTLGSELELASDSTGGVQDEAFVVELHVGVVLEVLALLAIPPHQRRTAAAAVLVHEAHGLLARVRWKPFSLLTEVDPSAITLARPIDVLKPRQMSLKFFGDSKNTGRHRAVVISNKNEPQGVARRECRLFAHAAAPASSCCSFLRSMKVPRRSRLSSGVAGGSAALSSSSAIFAFLASAESSTSTSLPVCGGSGTPLGGAEPVCLGLFFEPLGRPGFFFSCAGASP